MSVRCASNILLDMHLHYIFGQSTISTIACVRCDLAGTGFASKKQVGGVVREVERQSLIYCFSTLRFFRNNFFSPPVGNASSAADADIVVVCCCCGHEFHHCSQSHTVGHN